jgi:hypothetical protein
MDAFPGEQRKELGRMFREWSVIEHQGDMNEVGIVRAGSRLCRRRHNWIRQSNFNRRFVSERIGWLPFAAPPGSTFFIGS